MRKYADTVFLYIQAVICNEHNYGIIISLSSCKHYVIVSTSQQGEQQAIFHTKWAGREFLVVNECYNR